MMVQIKPCRAVIVITKFQHLTAPDCIGITSEKLKQIKVEKRVSDHLWYRVTLLNVEWNRRKRSHEAGRQFKSGIVEARQVFSCTMVWEPPKAKREEWKSGLSGPVKTAPKPKQIAPVDVPTDWTGFHEGLPPKRHPLHENNSGDVDANRKDEGRKYRHETPHDHGATHHNTRRCTNTPER
jgi:hypothetical protein